ncbi:MAG: polyprenyl synthetase family protein [Cellulosilyticaceae bacterium]
MYTMWDRYPDIKEELIAIVGIMDKNATCKDKVIESSIKEMVHSNGKMLRPAFTVIASKFGEYLPERTRAMAAVVEMFHMATLVHDDVIDDANLRRGVETVQSRYGKEYAVYIGDYLFCLCFKTLAETASLQTIKMDSRAMSRICLGEVEQLNSRFNKEVSVKNYLKRVSGKTAELFSLSLYIGAAESECEAKLARLFWNIGHNIGMAFQIIDDILDYISDEATLGKDVGNDIKDGLYTLPLIHVLEKKPQDILTILEKDSYEEQDISEIVRLTKKYGGVDAARELAHKYTKKAYKLIDKLPENEYKDILKEIVGVLLDRKY